MITGTEATRPSLNALIGWSLIWCGHMIRLMNLRFEPYLYAIHIWSPLQEYIKKTIDNP